MLSGFGFTDDNVRAIRDNERVRKAIQRCVHHQQYGRSSHQHFGVFSVAGV